ncbi:hypothetical protein HQ533_00420 [Candidatus Woesearchaeota archaeon]|nr:hypothetical protein [Candidatus Woesearchaeota archaeon]
MKLVATSIENPLEERALSLYDVEFREKGDSGLVLFPEGSFDDLINLEKVVSLSDVYGITIVGTKDVNGHQQAVILRNGEEIPAQIAYPDVVLPGIFADQIPVPKTTSKEELTFFEQDKFYDVSSNGTSVSAFIRICSDISVSFTKFGKANLLLVPSAIQHPDFFFKMSMKNLLQSLQSDGKIIYSPSPTDKILRETLQSVGVYDTDLRQVGENVVERDYVVLERF